MSNSDAYCDAACSCPGDCEPAGARIDEGGHVTSGTLDNRDHQNKRTDAIHHGGAALSVFTLQHLQQAATSLSWTMAKHKQSALRPGRRWRHHLRIC